MDTSLSSSYPVLIIPGYGSPAFQTERVARKLQTAGLDTISIKLPWLAMGDMVRSAEIVAEQVRRVRENTGFEKVNLLGYSIGGIIARFYLQQMEGYPFLSRGAFVATPNSGTYFGYLGFFSPAGWQVRPGSPFMEGLNSSPIFESIAGRCLSIFVRWDGVILPSRSAYLSRGYNLMLDRPISHWFVVMNDAVILKASQFLYGTIPQGALPGCELGMLEEGNVLAVPIGLPVRRRYWSVFTGPLRSIGMRLRSLLKR